MSIFIGIGHFPDNGYQGRENICRGRGALLPGVSGLKSHLEAPSPRTDSHSLQPPLGKGASPAILWKVTGEDVFLYLQEFLLKMEVAEIGEDALDSGPTWSLFLFWLRRR